MHLHVLVVTTSGQKASKALRSVRGKKPTNTGWMSAPRTNLVWMVMVLMVVVVAMAAVATG